MLNKFPHTFHIPVMGLAYTVDTPIKVAHFGISSVISIGEDRLLETMRRHYSKQLNRPFTSISSKEFDYRAKRITAYLNIVQEIVDFNIRALKELSFDTTSDITRYFQMLPDSHPMSSLYKYYLQAGRWEEKQKTEELLRKSVTPGCIDVNIMTKTDRVNYDHQGNVIEDGSDAVAALRGYANSNLTNTSVVFSAGMNPRLFGYMEKLPQFFPDEQGNLNKKVIIKVSDYRSALIQGKYLAKKGIWVSEFRVESGLNCGGHAFATDGYLMGPILKEFDEKKKDLYSELKGLYQNALLLKNLKQPSELSIRYTVQGGIGNHSEDRLLRSHFGMDGTGWGTPFLLVPEATTVDNDTLKLLCKAGEKDVELSHNSPLGVRYYYLKGTSAEKEKLGRIKANKPGSPCTEKHLAFNTEFTKHPICTASRRYQGLKLEQLRTLNLPNEEYQKQVNEVTTKECLCIGLSNAAAVTYDEPFIKNLKAVTICPGPNIVNFEKTVTLKQMVDHIYGRRNILASTDRPHMFIKELQLYINFLKEMIDDEFDLKKINYYKSFFKNLFEGISYYETLLTGDEYDTVIFQSALCIEENRLHKLLDAFNEKIEHELLVPG